MRAIDGALIMPQYLNVESEEADEGRESRGHFWPVEVLKREDVTYNEVSKSSPP